MNILFYIYWNRILVVLILNIRYVIFGLHTIWWECKINEIISLGENGGAGNLIVSEILLIHIDKNILDKSKNIDPKKINLVGRLGFDWYIKSDPNSLFEIKKKIK